VQCGFATYCPNGDDGIPCPLNSNTTSNMSIAASECICNEGYSGFPGSNCTQCAYGDFCPRNTTVAEPCPPGFYCPMKITRHPCPNNGSYCPGSQEVLQACPGGHYCPTSTSIVKCLDPALQPGTCKRGYFCPNGSQELNTCQQGFYCPNVTAQIRCANTSTCPIGSTTETNCAFGFKCNQTSGQTEQCSPGEYCPLGQLDAVPCPANFSCPTGFEIFPCSKGFYCPPGTVFSSLCPEGSYCPFPSLRIPCENGTYCTPGSVTNATCPAGSYCPTPSKQVFCAPGEYCPVGATAPRSCPEGNFCSQPNSVESCPNDGSYCPEGTFAKRLCSIGHYCETSTAQIRCANGTFSRRPGVTACDVCQENHFCDTISETPCPSNSFSPSGSYLVSQCVCGENYVGEINTRDDTCREKLNTFDITSTVVLGGILFMLFVLAYFVCTSKVAAKTFRSLLKDTLIVSFGIVSNVLNYATDIATFVNIVLPNRVFSAYVYPIIVVLIIGGIGTICSVYVNLRALWDLHDQASSGSETGAGKLEGGLGQEDQLVTLTLPFARKNFSKLSEQYPEFHKADEGIATGSDQTAKENPHWESVFSVLLRPYDPSQDKSDVADPLEIPPRLTDSLVKAVLKFQRERTLLTVDITLLVVQAIPMFLFTVGPVLSEAPCEDIRSLTFRASIILGALVIGAKLSQSKHYFRLESLEMRMKKATYSLCIATHTRTFCTHETHPEAEGKDGARFDGDDRESRSSRSRSRSRSNSPRNRPEHGRSMLNVIVDSVKGAIFPKRVDSRFRDIKGRLQRINSRSGSLQGSPRVSGTLIELSPVPSPGVSPTTATEAKYRNHNTLSVAGGPGYRRQGRRQRGGHHPISNEDRKHSFALSSNQQSLEQAVHGSRLASPDGKRDGLGLERTNPLSIGAASAGSDEEFSPRPIRFTPTEPHDPTSGVFASVSDAAAEGSTIQGVVEGARSGVILASALPKGQQNNNKNNKNKNKNNRNNPLGSSPSTTPKPTMAELRSAFKNSRARLESMNLRALRNLYEVGYIKVPETSAEKDDAANARELLEVTGEMMMLHNGLWTKHYIELHRETTPTHRATLICGPSADMVKGAIEARKNTEKKWPPGVSVLAGVVSADVVTPTPFSKMDETLSTLVRFNIVAAQFKKGSQSTWNNVEFRSLDNKKATLVESRQLLQSIKDNILLYQALGGQF